MQGRKLKDAPMNTRYGLSRDAKGTEGLRVGRTLVSLVPVATLVAQTLLGAMAAGDQSSKPAVPATDAAPPVAATGA
jgi:hypothetical protein